MAPVPSISVLMPVYNGAGFLATSLASLARQTLTDFEIVAVDDGSTDESAAVLAAWQRREPRLRVLRRPHEGLVATLNAGLEECRGELIARMDSDDVALPLRLEQQRSTLHARRDLDVVSCLVEHFADDEVREGMRIYEDWLNGLTSDALIKRDRFIESPLAHPSVMIRTSVLTAVGGYRDCGWPEDYDLWLRLAARGCRFHKVPRSLLRWRDHPARLTRAHGRYAVERFLECKAHHLVRGPLRGRSEVVVWGAGRTGRRLSKHLLRRGVDISSFVDVDRRKQGRSLRGRPIQPTESLDGLRDDRPRPLVLAAVASRGARALIRQRLAAGGWRETIDFWCVA